MRHTRYDFLRERGLGHDPFSTSVAEYELYSRDGLSYLLSYLVPLETLYLADKSPAAIPSPLTNTVIYGPVGSGKTALRYNTEALYRIARNQTLVVSYSLDDPDGDFQTTSQLGHLVTSIATDLFIQITEQFNPQLLPVDPAMTVAVSTLLHGTRAFHPSVRDRILTAVAEDITDLSVCWRWLRRPAVFSVPLSRPLCNLVRACLTDAPASNPSDYTGLLNQAIQVANMWGYEHVVVTVDIGPNIDGASSHTREWAWTLLQMIESCRGLPISFRLFLPLNFWYLLRKPLMTLVDGQPFVERFIAWTNPQLRAVLAQRFRAGGIRGEGLYSLADDHLAPVLDDLVIEGAKGSPRKMIELVQALLNAHLARGRTTTLIDQQTWRQLGMSWNGYLPPLPTPEIGNAV